MRRVLLFILPILIIIAIVFSIFGLIQVKAEEAKLLDELMRKAKAVAESIDLSARHILANNDMKSAMHLVEKFQKRERMQGCVIYGKDGEALAVTERFSGWKDKEKPHISAILSGKAARGAAEKFKGTIVYSYAIPVLGDDDNVLGAVELLYDTSYVYAQVGGLWRRLSIALIALVTLIIIVSLVIQRRIFVTPIEQLTEWFRDFEKGDIDVSHSIKGTGELGKLASEVEQAALGIRVARKAVAEEATQRIQKEDSWTEEKLKDVVRANIGENALFVVSNREPYMHITDEATGDARCVRPASGVVTAIDPILRACGGTWIAHGSGNADKKFVNSRNKLGVPPGDDRYILKRVWLSKEEEEGYYYGFANEGLWPICHNTYTRPIFRESDWNMYKKVNEKFAENIIEELPANNPMVFIQDYHFSVLPDMIKKKRPDTTIALFWHIPWPNPEIFSICPYQKEILEGMLGCDLIGFHTQYHCNNFIDTVNRFLECRVDTEKFSVTRSDKETLVRAFPISIDGYFGKEAPSGESEEIARIKREFELDGKIVAIGVERIDYTKGMKERFLAIDRFLDKNPGYRTKFVYIQLAAPSRTHIKSYHDLIGDLEELVEKINWKHMAGAWRPIVYRKKHFSPEDISPFYKVADICIVSSLHDGMNLVSKEYVASKNDGSGALLLSRFTGASRELTDAVIVNPYSIEEFADSIKLAVEMPPEEKKRRMENMRKQVEDNNVYKWAANIVKELASLKKI